MKLTYAEQLRHPNWQRKRLEQLESAGWQCQNCGDKGTTLHVHHKRYIKGRMAWEYSGEELAVLCEPCHAEEHANREILDRLLSENNGTSALAIAVGLVGGFLDANCDINDEDLAYACVQTYGAAFDMGVLASLAIGADWSKLHAAAEILKGGELTPVQRIVLERWKEGPN